MTPEEVRAAADAIMPPDAEIAEAMRTGHVVVTNLNDDGNDDGSRSTTYQEPD